MGDIQVILGQFVHLVVNSAKFSISLQAVLMSFLITTSSSLEKKMNVSLELHPTRVSFIRSLGSVPTTVRIDDLCINLH